MKNGKVGAIVKRLVSVLSAVAKKSKSVAIGDKIGSIRARIELFSLMKTRKLCLQGRLGAGAISHRIHAFLGQNHDGEGGFEEEDSGGKAVIDVNHCAGEEIRGQDDQLLIEYNQQEDEDGDADHCAASPSAGEDQLLLEYNRQEDEDDKYPDLRHSLFEEGDDDDDEQLGDPNGSAIEMVKSSKEEGGEKFNLEDEIDDVADLFIKKFYKRMRLQRLDSLKRFQEMLLRGT
ncbi:unnamed protein product [Cuscuta campestris]|uniref:DUF761 domain-containing protein n=1 Tax=Cuscuta campestris TaxID=132261 RepID=A0A484KFH9_9ASTE|nr:unnamed protein product [Cuscuta campestris]